MQMAVNKAHILLW